MKNFKSLVFSSVFCPLYLKQLSQLTTHFEIYPSFESFAVTKILSLSEITKKSLSPHIINYHIESFPTMYETKGRRNALVDKFEQYC